MDIILAPTFRVLKINTSKVTMYLVLVCMDEEHSPLFSSSIIGNTKCDRICENHPLTHTMTRHSFHCQSIALSVS